MSQGINVEALKNINAEKLKSVLSCENKNLQLLEDYSIYLPKEQKEILDKIVKDNTGLPYLYSVNDYYLPEGYVTEVSSTYKEEPIESRKADVHSSNPIISKTYIRLTQLAFDSEKMDVEEYKQ